MLAQVREHLGRLSYAGEIRVFGSCARGKADPGDLDVYVDLRGRSRQPAEYEDLLRIANRFYGSLDPFLRTDLGLLVRNDLATGWQRARGAHELELAMDSEGRQLFEATGEPTLVARTRALRP